MNRGCKKCDPGSRIKGIMECEIVEVVFGWGLCQSENAKEKSPGDHKEKITVGRRKVNSTCLCV